MKIKITEKILSIPPHLSTRWEDIKSLRVEHDPVRREDALVVTLSDGYRVKIFHLDEPTIDAIFAAHLRALEHRAEGHRQMISSLFPQTTDPFIQLLQLAQIEGRPKFHMEQLGLPLQHNPSQAHLPPLPSEILRKVMQIARALQPEEVRALPKPESRCNCLYCQIVRTIRDEWSSLHQSTTEELVSEEDLRFRSWNIAQEDTYLYVVSNPLDAAEYYHVFLGEPIGCSCGEKNCEHIQAVLRT